MFGRFKNWHSELSKLGKTALWISTGLVAGGVITAGASPAPQKVVETPKKETPAKVLSQSKGPKIEKKTVAETEAVPFEKISANDASLLIGTTIVTTAGVNGVKTISYEVTYTDGIQTNKKKIQEEITTQPIAEITAVGIKQKVAYVAPKVVKPKTSTPAPTSNPTPTSNCDPNYSGACVPNVYPADVDCAGGSGNGPYYIQGPVNVIGTDRYGLDANNDKVACQ